MAQVAKKLEITKNIPQVTDIPANSPRVNPIPGTNPYVKQERKLAIMVGALALIMACLVIWSNTTVTTAQAEMQDINQKVSTLQTSNANMKEEVSELSSRTRLMQIAKDVGLQMNDKNIRNVTK